MRIGHIFILVGTLVTVIVAGIILAFALVTYHSVDKAVLSAVKGELDFIKTSIEKIVEVTVAPARTARKLLMSHNWTIQNLPPYMSPAGQEQTQLINFTGAFEVFVTTLEAQPNLISYVYCTGKSLYVDGTWCDWGSIAGAAGTTLEVPDLIVNASITSGAFPPWNLVPLDVLPRVVTGASWQLETAALSQSEFDSGKWTSIAIFYDNFLNATTSLITYGLPMVFNETSGECICGFNIDVSVDGLGVILKSLATKNNQLFLVDVRKTLFHEGAIIASSLPESELPKFDVVSSQPYFPTATPNPAVNSLMQRIFNEYGGTVEHVRAASYDAILTDFEDSVVAVSHVFTEGRLHWIVVSSIPNVFYYGTTQRTVSATVGAGVGAVVLVAACFVAVHFALAKPIVRMLDSMKNIASLNEGALENDEPFLTELRPVHNELMRLDLAVQSFARYVPKDVVQGLLATSALCSLEMNQVHAVIMFTDIAGFTTLCENLASDVLNRLLTLYFETMTSILMDHAGVIDKFIGDAIMGIFNAPRQVEKPEALAAICALQMQRATTAAPLLTEFDAHGEAPITRIGIAGGNVLAGNIGSKMRLAYTLFGDQVNFASRLEGFNKQTGTRTLLSESVAALAVRDCSLSCRLLGRVLVQGKGIAIAIYEPYGLVDMVGPGGDGSGDFSSTESDGVELAGTAVEVNSPLKKRAANFGSIRRSTSNQFSSDGKSSGGRSDTRSGASSSVFFKSKKDMATHFHMVSAAARKECPASPGQRLYAKTFSRAAKLFTLGDFAGCLDVLHRIHSGVLAASLSNNAASSSTFGSANFARLAVRHGQPPAACSSPYDGSTNVLRRTPLSLVSSSKDDPRGASSNGNVIVVEDISGEVRHGELSSGVSGMRHAAQHGEEETAGGLEVVTVKHGGEHNASPMDSSPPPLHNATAEGSSLIEASDKIRAAVSDTFSVPTTPTGASGQTLPQEQQVILFPVDEFILDLQREGGPAVADKPWTMLRELCEEHIKNPPHTFLGAIVAKGK